MHILITRPEPAGRELVDLLKQIDIKTSYFPTLVIKTIRPSNLSVLTQAKTLIFTSPNAVSQGIHYLQQPIKQKIIAVGAGTGAALSRLGITVDIIPHEFNSEGLLKNPVLQQVRNQTIVIIKGRGGRELLQQELCQRGAKVDCLEVYQRNKPEGFIDVAVLNRIDWVLATSNESADNLLACTPNELKQLLLHKQWLVTSARIAQHVQVLGVIQQPTVVAQTRNAGLVTSLASLVNKS